MPDTDIKRYLDRIEIQHSVRPRFMAFVTELLDKLDSAHGIMKKVPELYDIRTAVGRQLDIVGECLGLVRQEIPDHVPEITEMPDDDLYRTVLMCKIAGNQWDGTNQGLIDIWNDTAGSLLDVTYKDNMNMSIDLTVAGPVDYSIVKLLDNEYIVPKPMGVLMETTVSTDNNLATNKVYFGICLYGVVVSYLGETDEPDLSDYAPLYDETEAILLDENYVAVEG